MQWLGLLCVFERCFRPPDRLSVLEKKYIECCCYVFTDKCLLFCGTLQSFSGFISVGSGTDWDLKAYVIEVQTEVRKQTLDLQVPFNKDGRQSNWIGRSNGEDRCYCIYCMLVANRRYCLSWGNPRRGMLIRTVCRNLLQLQLWT